MTHYEVLGVAPSASAAEIKQAYRRQARAHHPDTAGAGSATMQALNEAWSVLGDPARRRAYDRVIAVDAPPQAPPAQPAPPPFMPADDEVEPEWDDAVENQAPPSKRDVFVLVPAGLLGLSVATFALSTLMLAPVLQGLAIFLLAITALSFALVPILTLKRQARRTYR